MIRRYTVALMQMDTQNDKGKNLETACAWIDEAAAKGAKLICFPEVMNLIGKNIGEGGGREEIPGYTTERLCAKAKEHGVYIHGGSITQALPGEKRSANTSVLISPEGKILATYSKLHMFDITLADGTPYRESDRVKPGDSIVTVETELGVFGMSICYDLVPAAAGLGETRGLTGGGRNRGMVRIPLRTAVRLIAGGDKTEQQDADDADGKGSLGGSSAGAGDRERLLHRGTGTDWTETGVCGIRQQPGGRSVGNGDCTVKGCTGDHLCGD